MMLKDSLLLLVFVQVASSEWVLGVEIQHFENLYDAEIRDGVFCCCDNRDTTLCKENIIEMEVCVHSETIHGCDHYFLVYVRDCPYNSACTVTKHYRLNTTTTLVQLTCILAITLEMKMIENVRIKINS